MVSFKIRTTAHFDHEYRKLFRKHQDIHAGFLKLIGALQADPYNLHQAHPIKKLTGVKTGDGQYRFRIGRFRFRYDITDQTVYLMYCGLRNETTYQ